MALMPASDTSPLNEYELDLCGEIGGVIWADSVSLTNGYGIAVTLNRIEFIKDSIASIL